MTRIVRGTKRRRTPLLLMALLGLVLGVMIGGGTFGSAAPPTDANVVDYSQCANGKPNAGNDATTCNQGWINGILNANNSQYHEGQNTAQRLVLELPKNGPQGDGTQTGDRVMTFKYLWNKASHHAYDALGTWDATITGVTTSSAACAGVPGSCPITDPTAPTSTGAMTNSTCTDGNAPTGQFEMWGGTIDFVTQAVNDSGTCSTTADEYETVKVYYHVGAGGGTISSNTRVGVLFGGHLAIGTGVWGTNQGASDINGGPYHIKLVQVDNNSIGNRDNQISAGAILITTASMSTTPDNSETFSEDLSDSATVTGNNPTGNVTFYLYDNAADCALGSTTVGTGGLLYTQTVALSSGTASTDGTGSGDNTVTATGDYYWTVQYEGDLFNSAADSICQEHSAVTAPSVTNTGA
jgi:hypothetical protein